MPAAHQRIIYTPWTPGLQATWTVAGVRAALTAHEAGDFAQSAKLIDGMGRDLRLRTVEETRLKGLFASPFSLDPADEDDATDQRIAEDLDEQWLTMCSEATLTELWHWRLFAGVGLGELCWERTASAWIPIVKVWHPQHLYADEDRGVYLLQTREGQVEVPFGGGDGKWLVVGRGKRPWMDGLVRGLGDQWLGAYFGFRDWLRYCERHGMPIVKAMVPAFADDVDKEGFFTDIKALSTETTVQLPVGLDERGTGFDLDLLEATANTWEGFQGLLRHIYDGFAIALTGNNLTTLIEGGSFAAAKEAGTVRSLYSEGDAEELSTTLRAQLVKPWCKYNHGDESRAPWPRWETSPEEDVAAKAASIKTAGEALGALKSAGWEPVSIEEFAEPFGVQLQPIAKPAPSPFPPPFARPGDEDQEDEGQRPEDVEPPAELSRRVRRSKRTAPVVLASGDPPASAEAFVDGQLYVDAVADHGVRAQRKRPALQAVLAIIESSVDYPDLRARLRAAFSDMADPEFSELMGRALILSELAGRYAAAHD